MQKEVDFAFLKKRNKLRENKKKEQLKIKKKMLKKSTELDSAVTAFDVDLEIEFSKLSLGTQKQVDPYKRIAKRHKEEYLKRRQERIENEEKDFELEDSIINTLGGKAKENVENFLQKNFSDIDFKDRANFWVWKKYPKNQKLLRGKKILKNLSINISHIAKYVRKIPVVYQLLKSPFYRSELELQFEKWRKIRKEIFKEKLKKEEEEADIINQATEGILGDGGDDEDIYDQFQPVLEHHQELKFGGILKNFMDIWEIEETFLTILIVLLWITGNISISRDNEEDEIEFKLSLIDFPIIDIQNFDDENEVREAREAFTELIVANSQTESPFSQNEIKNISNLTFNWFKEIARNKQDLIEKKGIYENLDWPRIKKLGLKSFVNDLDTLEDLVERLTINEVFEEFFEDIDTDGTSASFRISNGDLESLYLSEINIIGLRQAKKRDKNELRSFAEVKDIHLLVWFMSNLLLMSNSIEESKEVHERVNMDFQKFKKDVGSMIDENDTVLNISDANETLFKFGENKDGEGEEEEEKLEESDGEDYVDTKKKPSPLETYKKSDLIPDYIPIFNIVNHFCLSITDNIFLRQTLGQEKEYEKVFQEYIEESKIEEITIEILGLMSILPPQGPVKELFRSSSPELSQFTINSFWNNIKELVKTIHNYTAFNEGDKGKTFKCSDFRKTAFFDFSIEFEDYIRNHIRQFLSGSLDTDLEASMSSILMDDLYLDIVRYFDNSKINAKIRSLAKKYKKKIEEISFTLCDKKIKLIATKFTEIPERGDPAAGIPLISFLSLRKDTEVNFLLDNVASCGIYIKILDNILESTKQILCKKNAEKNFKSLVSDCLEQLENMNKQGLNKKVPDALRFVKNKGRYAFQDKNLKKKWHLLRRFTPEFKNKGEKDSSIPKRVWDKCWPFISKSYWKVQLGFLTWYALVVDQAPYEESVCMLLKEIRFAEAVRRQTAIKVMGILGDCFKLFRNELEILNHRFSKIPWWVFSGADCIFGYTETDSQEHVDWQSMVMKNIVDWVGKREAENYSGYSLRYDVEMAMEHFLKDFKVSLAEGK